MWSSVERVIFEVVHTIFGAPMGVAIPFLLQMGFQFPVASGEKKQVQVFACPVETWKERKPRRNAVRAGDFCLCLT